MPVAVFIPCYVDQLRPSVGIATIRLLEHLRLKFSVLPEPTCCGQPFINMGAARAAECLVRRFHEVGKDYEAIICPSGSCVASLRHSQKGNALKSRIYELSEYLHTVGAVVSVAPYPSRVLLHPSCHGLRELGLGAPSEQPTLKTRDTVASLLGQVSALSLLRPERDECCGFGGVFTVTEPRISVRMATDRLNEYVRLGAEVITGTDISCLIHLEGVAKSLSLPLKFMHFSEVLMHGVLT